MNTKRISDEALRVIEQYKNFQIGNSTCSIPYFNNKTTARRAGLRAEIGKGSPKDIFDEAEHRAIPQKIDLNLLDSENLKKFLVDSNIGIDCSGFAYYVLNEESKSRGKGSIDKHLSFPLSKGIMGKIKSKVRPVENTDVQTLAHNKNSKIVSVKEEQVGDIVTMIGGTDGGERDHILIIHQIEYQNFLPVTVHYVHAVAWPTDGEYGHGIHEGKIEIVDVSKSILEQKWIEMEKTGVDNYTFSRAGKSVTEIRRLNWF